jgi:hypothetical protein
MTGQEEQGFGADGGRAGRRGGRGYGTRARVEDLAASVPEETITGGKTFYQLGLNDQKSVLIDRELE